MNFDVFLLICNYVGTLAFAVSGAVKGFKKRLDIFGITLLACITAVGGGIIRDTMVGKVPVALIQPGALYLSIVVAILLYLFVIHQKQEQPKEKQFYLLLTRINLTFDAIGLAAFALIGASTGVDLQLNPMTSGILAVLTGVGGGIIRDLLVNETPIVLKEDVYAVLALFSGLAYHILVLEWQFPRIPTFLLLFILVLIIRLVVIKYQIHLPNMERKSKP